jgi:hypothetical protein
MDGWTQEAEGGEQLMMPHKFPRPYWTEVYNVSSSDMCVGGYGKWTVLNLKLAGDSQIYVVFSFIASVTVVAIVPNISKYWHSPRIC